MTTRHAWDDLPAGAKQAVEDRIGQVLKTESTPGGRNSELSETLWTDHGPVFCKGISTDSPISYMHRNEIAVNPFLPAACCGVSRPQGGCCSGTSTCPGGTPTSPPVPKTFLS